MVQLKFKCGDLVKLKSGGPVMTVSCYDMHGVKCNWFDGNKEKQSANFEENELEMAKNSKKAKYQVG